MHTYYTGRLKHLCTVALTHACIYNFNNGCSRTYARARARVTFSLIRASSRPGVGGGKFFFKKAVSSQPPGCPVYRALASRYNGRVRCSAAQSVPTKLVQFRPAIITIH